MIQVLQESKKRKRDDVNTANKFISVAEQTKLFESQLRYYLRSPTTKYYPTIPESPILLTETRVRSMKNQSTEDGEQKEMSKSKVMPVNSKIHEPLKLEKCDNTSPLVGKPFELTVYKRKVVHDSSSPFRFDAKSSTTEELHNQCDTTDKSFISLAAEPLNSESYETHLQSRIQTSKDTGDNLIVLGKSPNGNININKTQPNPFSFEERDKLVMKNKNEKMKKRKEMAEKEQEEEVALLRRQTVHKPQPIGKSKSQPKGSKHAVIS
ncbi:Protein of unknown function [Gryllus bimaculatus]|nr:Protein of unknown function [Gryllus bimaculatus]